MDCLDLLEVFSTEAGFELCHHMQNVDIRTGYHSHEMIDVSSHLVEILSDLVGLVRIPFDSYYTVHEMKTAALILALHNGFLNKPCLVKRTYTGLDGLQKSHLV